MAKNEDPAQDRPQDVRGYEELTHAMQSGVLSMINHENTHGEKLITEGECANKHLRVGVNSAISAISALAKLLADKGVIDAEEYSEAVRLGMAQEVADYEAKLSEIYGRSIVLG